MIDHQENQSLFQKTEDISKTITQFHQICESRELSSHNFTVAVRIKPTQMGDNFKVVLNKNHKQIHIQTSKGFKNSYYGSKSKNFKMNSIFPDDTLNLDIFQKLVAPKLSLLKNNCNVALMAYGATNCGKSYTVFGDKQRNNEGLAFLCGDYLINTLFRDKYKFYFSYLEIYNENIQDLLTQRTEKRHYLNIFQDHNGKVNIPDLTKIQIQGYSHLCELIEKGNQARAEASNNLNIHSSRSHAILQIDIFSIDEQDNTVTLTPVDANFMILDLAGSQKSSLYYQEGHQTLLKEGGNINKSLLALGNCILNLSNGETHIPYRDSKLTRILKDHLSGYCHNIMIACISQQNSQYEETINTLQYSSKAYKIQSLARKKGKDRSKYVQIPCQHCQMGLDFGYISKILRRYHYEVVDTLEQGNGEVKDRRIQKSVSSINDKQQAIKFDDNSIGRTIKGRKRQRSLTINQQKKGLGTTQSVSLNKSEKIIQKPLKLVVKGSMNLSNKNKSQEKFDLKLPLKKQSKGSKQICINMWEALHKHQPSANSFLKYSSINSKKQDSLLNSYQEQHSIAPFIEQQHSDHLNLYATKEANQKQNDQEQDLKYRIRLKRNSEPRHMHIQNKQNYINFNNIDSRQGCKTTREEPNILVVDNYQNTTSVFSKAAKRMRPDTVEPFPQVEIQTSRSEKQRPSKQRIKIIPKLR